MLALLAGCPDEPCPDGWRTLHDDTDGVLLSVQGTGPDDVWVAGGGLEQGFATLRHYDGGGWDSIAVDDDRTLWWVTPDGEGGAWSVGERGAIVHVAADGAVTRHDADTTATFFGVFAVAGDVWVVGEDATVLRGQGGDFTPVPPPIAAGTTLYKVWAADGANVWVSGASGTMLRWDGNGWVDHSAELSTTARVLTVHGCSAVDVYAVAGQTLYHYGGDAWGPDTDHVFPTTLNGVSCRDSFAVVLAGNGGYRARIDDDLLEEDTFEGTWDTDYHSIWAGAGMWAAGGSFNAPAPAERRGVLSTTAPCAEGPPGF